MRLSVPQQVFPVLAQGKSKVVSGLIVHSNLNVYKGHYGTHD
jgi:hypothetical protein